MSLPFCTFLFSSFHKQLICYECFTFIIPKLGRSDLILAVSLKILLKLVPDFLIEQSALFLIFGIIDSINFKECDLQGTIVKALASAST